MAEILHTLPEETKRKASHRTFAQLPKSSKERVNPLLSNKGSVRPRLSSLALPRTPAPSLSSTTVVPPKLDKERDESSSDDVSSELDSSERFRKLANLCQLPLFEIHGTMHVLRQKRTLQHERGKRSNEFRKSRTMHGARTPGAQEMLQTLTQEQHKYFGHMKESKTDYMSHMLNCKQIYFQYVAVSKTNMWFLKSAEFEVMTSKLMEQKERFRQDKARFAGTSPDAQYREVDKKTLVLDLDETLVFATAEKQDSYDTTLPGENDSGEACKVREGQR